MNTNNSKSLESLEFGKPDVLRKIGVDQLQPGMYLHSLCGSWLKHPFWRSKFTIKDTRDIRLIIDSGITEVVIDVAKGIDVLAEEVLEAREPVSENPFVPRKPLMRDSAPHPTSMTDELKLAVKICARAKETITSMFEEARMGKAISAGAAGEMVEEIALSVQRNPGALISLARLKTADDYTYMHSVAVCGLMVALSRQLGLDEKQTRDAGMAGLLHDLGKAMVPKDILNKPGKLTEEEFSVVKSHPERGHSILLEGGGVGEVPLDVCLHHHEKMNGTGYPNRLCGDQISMFAKMGAVCDVYDAITSNRPYKIGWDPAQSLRKMKAWCDGHLESKIFQAFVKSIGIYPVGSLVRLSSGRLAVVVEQSKSSLLTPNVKAFFSTKSQAHVPPELISLSRRGTVESIVDHEDPAEWGFNNLDRFLAPQ